MDSETYAATYAAALNRTAEALHQVQQEDRTEDATVLPLDDHSLDYQEKVYYAAAKIVDALRELLQDGGVHISLPEPSHIVTDDLAYFEPDPGLPAVSVEDGIVRYGSQSYWNITKGDSPLALAAALLAAEQYAKAAV